ncbi:MAG TPA: HAMP domain-containing sensor histidine kinase [Kofleriaceae bacterium]
MKLALEPAVTLPWLVRLRWASIAFQLAMFPALHAWFQLPLHVARFSAVIAISVVSNLGLAQAAHKPRWSGSTLIGLVMVGDTLLLTAQFLGAGASTNPFTVLYLVQIALSALVLDGRWTAAIVGLSLGGFALLFASAPDETVHMHSHLQTMWGAFAIAAVLIAFFVARVTRSIGALRDQIARLRESSERSERLAAVTRLAAGAAHELGSPLATIAIAAHEARRHLDAAPGATRQDLDLIALEVERCQQILERLAAQGSAPERETRIRFDELEQSVRDYIGEDRAARLEFAAANTAAEVVAPADQLVATIVALVENGLQADDAGRVTVELGVTEAWVSIAIQDRGAGIEPAMLDRIGTPFYTTKGSGRGLGLGVFLARAFCASRGGDLEIDSRLGAGTRAVIRLPHEAAA